MSDDDKGVVGVPGPYNDRYWPEWDENSEISRWNGGRHHLNIIIRAVNDWTVDGCDAALVPRLRRELQRQRVEASGYGDDWEEVFDNLDAYLKESEGPWAS